MLSFFSQFTLGHLAIFIFVALFVSFFAVDRLALSQTISLAKVTAKTYNPPRTSYHMVYSGGRSWSQADPIAETYVLSMQVSGAPTVGIVRKDSYDRIQVGDTVKITFHKTRITKRLEVVFVEQS